MPHSWYNPMAKEPGQWSGFVPNKDIYLTKSNFSMSLVSYSQGLNLQPHIFQADITREQSKQVKQKWYKQIQLDFV